MKSQTGTLIGCMTANTDIQFKGKSNYKLSGKIANEKIFLCFLVVELNSESDHCVMYRVFIIILNYNL